MSGARLEIAGQIRDGFPFMAMRQIKVAAFNIISATPAVLPFAQAAISDALDIPFDRGPDRSGRVFVCINGYSILVNSSVVTVSAGQINGNFYYRALSGERILLGTVAINAPVNALAIRYAFNFPNIIVSTGPLFADKVDSIGTVEWENDGSILGGINGPATATINLNVGYYGDYAEFDIDCLHNDIHGIKEHNIVDMHKV